MLASQYRHYRTPGAGLSQCQVYTSSLQCCVNCSYSESEVRFAVVFTEAGDRAPYEQE